MPALEVVARLALIGGSASINLAGYVSIWISVGLGLVAMIATAELAVRPYGARIFDRLLLIAGSLITVFILLGLVLNVTPWGMTRGTWNVAWAIVGIGVLIWRRGTHTHFILPYGPISVLSLSIVAAAAIIIGAGFLAVDGVSKSESEPVLSLSLVSSSSTRMTIEVDARSVSGSYLIMAFPQVNKTSSYKSKPFSVSAGIGGETVQRQVPVKVKGTWIVELVADGGKAIRQLIVNIS